jgi:hypothetical protein
MCLAGRESEMDRQAIGVHDHVNLAGQAPSQAEWKTSANVVPIYSRCNPADGGRFRH